MSKTSYNVDDEEDGDDVRRVSMYSVVKREAHACCDSRPLARAVDQNSSLSFFFFSFFVLALFEELELELEDDDGDDSWNDDGG